MGTLSVTAATIATVALVPVVMADSNFTLSLLNSSQSFNNEPSNVSESECDNAIDELIDMRFITSGILGFIISVLGVIANTCIIYTFCRMYNKPQSALLLQSLAVFDIGVLVCYVYLYSIQFILEKNDYSEVYTSWVQMVPYTYPFSRISQTATVYIMLVAMLERSIFLFKHGGSKRMLTKASYVGLISGAVSLSVLFHISRYFEIEVAKIPNCTGFAGYKLTGSHLLGNWYYRTIFGVWFTNISQVLLPFGTFVVLSVINVFKFQQMIKEDSLRNLFQRSAEAQDRRRKVRDTTLVLIVLVVMYLIFNSLGLILTIWELFDRSYLESNRAMYITIVEIINLCAITNSSIRIINYLSLNCQFRQTFVRIFMCGPADVKGFTPVATDLSSKSSNARNGEGLIDSSDSAGFSSLIIPNPGNITVSGYTAQNGASPPPYPIDLKYGNKVSKPSISSLTQPPPSYDKYIEQQHQQQLIEREKMKQLRLVRQNQTVTNHVKGDDPTLLKNKINHHRSFSSSIIPKKWASKPEANSVSFEYQNSSFDGPSSHDEADRAGGTDKTRSWYNFDGSGKESRSARLNSRSQEIISGLTKCGYDNFNTNINLDSSSTNCSCDTSCNSHNNVNHSTKTNSNSNTKNSSVNRRNEFKNWGKSRSGEKKCHKNGAIKRNSHRNNSFTAPTASANSTVLKGDRVYKVLSTTDPECRCDEHELIEYMV